MTILEQLYYGNVRPYSKAAEPNKQLEEAEKIKSKNMEKLTAMLDNSGKTLFQKYIDAEQEAARIAQYNTYSYAFKLGALLIAETYAGKSEIDSDFDFY